MQRWRLYNATHFTNSLAPLVFQYDKYKDIIFISNKLSHKIAQITHSFFMHSITNFTQDTKNDSLLFEQFRFRNGVFVED